MQLTPEQIEYFVEHLPLIEARRHYSQAQLNTDFREMFFPRYLDPDPNPSSAPPRRRDPWRVEDVLPPFADFKPPHAEHLVPAASLEALRGAYALLPAWAQRLAAPLTH